MSIVTITLGGGAAAAAAPRTERSSRAKKARAQRSAGAQLDPDLVMISSPTSFFHRFFNVFEYKKEYPLHNRTVSAVSSSLITTEMLKCLPSFQVVIIPVALHTTWYRASRTFWAFAEG